MEDRWLSGEEISVYLGVTRETVYKWLSEKKLPTHKVGRLLKFKKEDVDVWVKAQSNSHEIKPNPFVLRQTAMRATQKRI